MNIFCVLLLQKPKTTGGGHAYWMLSKMEHKAVGIVLNVELFSYVGGDRKIQPRCGFIGEIKIIPDPHPSAAAAGGLTYGVLCHYCARQLVMV